MSDREIAKITDQLLRLEDLLSSEDSADLENEDYGQLLEEKVDLEQKLAALQSR